MRFPLCTRVSHIMRYPITWSHVVNVNHFLRISVAKHDALLNNTILCSYITKTARRSLKNERYSCSIWSIPRMSVKRNSFLSELSSSEFGLSLVEQWAQMFAQVVLGHPICSNSRLNFMHRSDRRTHQHIHTWSASITHGQVPSKLIDFLRHTYYFNTWLTRRYIPHYQSNIIQ